MLPVLSPVTDYRSPVFLDLVIQLDKTLFHGEVIRDGGLDSVKEDTAVGIGDGDEDMLTPDEAVRRQGAEIFRERAANIILEVASDKYKTQRIKLNTL